MKLITFINPEGATEKEIANCRHRKAARAVVFDKDGMVALLHVKNGNYYKIPGGGIEEGEDIRQAVDREAEEETGCSVEIGEEIGKIIECRKETGFYQESYGYVARVVGEKKNTNFTEHEKQEGFELLWVDVDEAIKFLTKEKVEDYNGWYMNERDHLFLQEVIKTMVK